MATYYFRSTGGGGNWGTAASWSLTNGGGATGAVPLATDDVIFTNLSQACSVNISTAVCKSISFATYTNTITMTNGITVSGNVTLGASMGIAGTGALTVNATGTLTSGGKVWPNGLNLRGISTFTLADNWVVTGNLLIGAATETIVINGAFNLSTAGNFTTGTSSTISGAATIVLNGTGIWSNTSTGAVRNNLTINTSGTITVSGNIYYNTGTLTYTAGTVVTTGSTLNVTASTTLNTNGITWNNITMNAATVTLTSQLNISGTFSVITTSSTVNGGTINCTGNASSSTLNGTGTLLMSGTGTLTGIYGSINLTINTVGTITITGTLNKGGGTFTYTAGAVLVGTSTLLITSSTTLNISGVTWNNVTINDQTTVTLSANLNVGGVLTLGSSGNFCIINGAFNINANGNVTVGGTAPITGTATLVFTGTGTWSHSSTAPIRLNTIINTSGILTISGNFYYNTGTLTYTAGTVVTTGSTLITSTATLNTNGITWNNVSSPGGGTITLTSNFTIGGNYTLTSGTQSWNNGVNSVSINGDMILGTLTYTSTASFIFNVPNNLTINNLTLYTTAVNSSSTNNCQINGLYTININGNLTTTTASVWVGFISGNSTLKMTGTGTLFTVYGACIGNPLIIDTTGTITFGSTVSVGGGSFTYVKGGILNDISCTLQIMLGQTMGLGKSIVFANIAQGYATQAIAWPIGVTLTNDLATLGTYSTGTFAPINLTPIDGAGYYLYVGGFNNSRTTSGTATIVFRYSGTWASSAYLTNNIIVDTTGTLTWGNISYYQSGTITFVRGNFSSNPWYLYQNMTLIDVDKVIIPNVVITAGLIITINKMFTGSPTLKSTISSTTTANYTLSFNDRTEKFSKFIRLSNATCLIPGQLTVITKSGNRGNNVGISFYPNQKPNGFAKNSPSVTNTQTYGFGGILSDPIFN